MILHWQNDNFFSFKNEFLFNFLDYYYSLSTVIYNDIVIWIIMLIFNTSDSYFHKKKSVNI
jgi:hypothetical protein